MDTLAIIILGGVLLNFAQSIASDNTRILQYYSGTLTSITCSTTTPSFLINGIYGAQHYETVLPGLYDIEARVAPDRSNVTLLVHGSSMAHNVTIECQNIIDPVTGQKESMFQLTLLFADPIPAPHGVQYNANDGVLHWSPPRIEEILNSNMNVALMITRYIIYVTDLETGLLIANFTTTGPETNIAILDAMSDVPCSISIQVSAVNPAGEGQRSTSITNNQCSPGLVTTPKESTTQQMDIENDNSPERVALSFGGIAAVVITLIIVAIVVCIALLTVLWVFTKNRRASKTKSTVINQEDPEQKGQLRSLSEVSDTSDNSQTKLLTPSSSPMVTPEQPAITQHEVQSLENEEATNNSNTEKHETQLQCTQHGQLIYAELAPTVVNSVSQPSSVENTAYAVINHTNQTE